MTKLLDYLIARAESAPLSWHPKLGGKRAWICFDDHRVFDLDADPHGERFRIIAAQMMSGHYYPSDVIQVSGRFARENRPLRAGDRVVQQVPLFGRLGGPLLNSVVEIFVAERTEKRCRIGYVTTNFHFGRGIWSALLILDGNNLKIEAQSTTSPHSWLFWLGLPYARFLQLRARRRAVEEFRNVLPALANPPNLC